MWTKLYRKALRTYNTNQVKFESAFHAYIVFQLVMLIVWISVSRMKWNENNYTLHSFVDNMFFRFLISKFCFILIPHTSLKLARCFIDIASVDQLRLACNISSIVINALNYIIVW